MDEDELRGKVYHYRMAGDSIPDIAERLDISKMKAAALYREHVVEMAKISEDDDRQGEIALDLARLDKMQAAIWTQATETHKKHVLIGKGDNAYYDTVDADPDLAAQKAVLDIMKQRAALKGWDKLDAKDQQTVTMVLVAGQDTAGFLAALEEGRRQPELTSEHRDNDIEGEAVQVEEFTT